jgi:Papain family cysteine protease
MEMALFAVMSMKPRSFGNLLLATWLLATGLPAVRADDAPVKPGATFESLVVGKNTYLHVKVLSISPHTIMIAHAGGMTSVHLRDLSPEWQARFGFDATAEPPEFSTPTPVAAPVRPAPTPRAALTAAHDIANRFVYLGKQFGQPAEIKPEVNLQPLFFQLELSVKNQGRRPSCSVFAIVSALEFQNAQLTGHTQKFSEEYLIWATRKITKRTAPSPKPGDEFVQENFDEGFSLSEVIEAIHVYGVPLQQSLPNTFGRKMEDIEDPPEAVVDEARTHEKVFAFVLPGHDPATRINNLVQSLNAGIPVTVGIGWPNYRSLRNGYLSGQTPMKDKAHAVTIVGYKSDTGSIENAYFIFKNSYGATWGQGGYGTISYKYLTNYLYDAVLLEVLPG